ncbi:unnamed protein product, partial [Ectocarpus sp. 12 AP-2014]
GRNDSVVSRGASMSARTEGMTTWASNSSNTSSNMRSGASSRLASGFMAAVSGGGGGGGAAAGGREQVVAASPSSSAASTSGSAEKWNKIVKGLKRMGPSMRGGKGGRGGGGSLGEGEGSATFDERGEETEEGFAARKVSLFDEEGRGGGRRDDRDYYYDDDDVEDDEDDDDADDVDLAEWEISRVGKRAGDARYVVQLRQPSSGSFLLLGTTDALVYEEWVEDILYVQQRTLALEWTRRFRSKMSKDSSPPLSAFKLLPDRDWNREWEAACSLTGGGRGGRDPRVTISLGQQFRAFAGAVAGAAMRASLRQRQQSPSPSQDEGWESLAPLRPMEAENEANGGGDTRTGDVRAALSRSTPDDCWSFLMGNVAFVLAPRGPGGGYKTHKRLGAELKGAQVLSRRAVERRVLSGVGSGGAGPELVNALAPLSCVVDLYGFRAAAVALPAFMPRTKSKQKLRARPKLLGNGGEVGFGGGGEGEGEGAGAVGTDRASLVVEAVSALLECGRESVASACMLSHGLDLYYNKDVEAEAGDGAAAASSLDGGGGGSRHLLQNGGGGGGVAPGTNERASGLAGRRIVGDAVVVLVGGGMGHGAAGSGDVDGDGAANGDRTCNPLRLREELMRERMQPRPSIEEPSEAVKAAVERGGGSALLSETLLPRLAGRLASDALMGGSVPLARSEERSPPLFLFDGGHLCAAMHGAGINLRYLPMLRRSLGWEHEGNRQL